MMPFKLVLKKSSIYPTLVMGLGLGFLSGVPAQSSESIPDQAIIPPANWVRPIYDPKHCACDKKDPWDSAPAAAQWGLSVSDARGCLPCEPRNFELVNISDPAEHGRVVISQVSHLGNYYLAKIDPARISRVLIFDRVNQLPGHAYISMHFQRGSEVELIAQRPDLRGATPLYTRDLVFEMRPGDVLPFRDGSSGHDENGVLDESRFSHLAKTFNGVLPMAYLAHTLEDLKVQRVQKGGESIRVFELDPSKFGGSFAKLFMQFPERGPKDANIQTYMATERNCVTELMRYIDYARDRSRSSGTTFKLQILDGSFKIDPEALPREIGATLRHRHILLKELPRLTLDTQFEDGAGT